MKVESLQWAVDAFLAVVGALALLAPAKALGLGLARSGNGLRAVEAEHVQEALRARERQQAAVARLGQRGLADVDLAGLMDEAVALAAGTLDMEYSKILELAPAGDALLLRAGVGWREGLVGHARVGTRTDSQAGYTLLSQEPLIVEDLRREVRFQDHEMLLEHGVISGMSVIIPGRERPFGVLSVHTTRKRAFTKDDIHFLEAIAHVLGAAIDRKRSEQALLERQEQYRGLYLAVSGGVVVQDRDGTIVDANAAACEILGVTLEELEERSLRDPRWESIHEDGSPFPGETHPAMVALRTGRAVRDVIVGIRRPRCGSRRWILVNSQPLLDPSTAAPQSVVTTFVDITERKQAEDYLAFVAEVGGVLVSSLDYQTTLSSVARLVVPRLADWCGIEVIGDSGILHPLALAHVDPVKMEMAAELRRRYPPDPSAPWGVPRVVRTGVPEIYREVPDSLIATVARDPEHLRALRAIGLDSVMFVPLRARGRILGAITFVAAESGRRYGPTDLRLAEDLARISALAVDNARLYRDAQEAIQSRDDFLSMAAHELKTPITSLRGFAQLAVRQMDRNGTIDPVQARQVLRMMDHQSRRLSHLVSQLLDVSRIDAGRLALNRRTVDLVGLVQSAVAAAQANADGHDFSLLAPPSVLAMVDPLLIERVIDNLVDNALRYSPGGGAIDIEVSTPNDGSVRLAVRDHGIGIQPEHRERVFDRYYRAHDGDNLGGLGLGLYISCEIVRLHGGGIELECPPDGGTRFLVSLPTGFGEASDR